MPPSVNDRGESRALVQIVYQHFAERTVGVHEHALDVIAMADVVEAGVEAIDGRQIGRAEVVGPRVSSSSGISRPTNLIIPSRSNASSSWCMIWNSTTSCLLIAQPLQGRLQRVEIGEEVAEDDHDLAAAHAAGQFGQALGHPRFFDRA